MNFTTQRIEDIVVFSLNEHKLDANNSGLVKAEFTLLMKLESVKKLIIDLTDVESCDSTGLSALLVANRLVNANNGEVCLVSTSEKVLSLIRITQLNKVLSVHTTLAEALQELKDK
jgi:anti-anti-sigma factor